MLHILLQSFYIFRKFILIWRRIWGWGRLFPCLWASICSTVVVISCVISAYLKQVEVLGVDYFLDYTNFDSGWCFSNFHFLGLLCGLLHDQRVFLPIIIVYIFYSTSHIRRRLMIAKNIHWVQSGELNSPCYLLGLAKKPKISTVPKLDQALKKFWPKFFPTQVVGIFLSTVNVERGIGKLISTWLILDSTREEAMKVSGEKSTCIYISQKREIGSPQI